MARTGIQIGISNTQLGGAPNVDTNSMLIVSGASAVSNTFLLDTPYLLQSSDDLERLGVSDDNNKDVVGQVEDYFSSFPSSLLWLVGAADNVDATENIKDYVQATVLDGFEYRPRQIGLSVDPFEVTQPDPSDVQAQLTALYEDGFSCVALMGGSLIEGAIKTAVTDLPSLTGELAPLVGVIITTNEKGKRHNVGDTLGFMASLTVGTSIGDASTPSRGNSFYFVDGTFASKTYINTPCATLPLSDINLLGDKQYIFMRTRPPKNGLWYNDGATCEDPATALSTLEAGRTIGAIVDDLREFFTPYLNNRIPVSANGDIQGGYKQVVLDNARASVIQQYIDTGDISDARISLSAKDGNFVSSREWVVSVEILPANTLRWISASVFYVKQLN